MADDTAAEDNADAIPAEIQRIPFEQALDELEEIVRQLEDGELSLEESLQQFEHGSKLAAHCRQKLKHTQRRIEILKKTGPDQADWDEFEDDATATDDEAGDA